MSDLTFDSEFESSDWESDYPESPYFTTLNCSDLEPEPQPDQILSTCLSSDSIKWDSNNSWLALDMLLRDAQLPLVDRWHLWNAFATHDGYLDGTGQLAWELTCNHVRCGACCGFYPCDMLLVFRD
jgi:hypothetical protein